MHHVLQVAVEQQGGRGSGRAQLACCDSLRRLQSLLDDRRRLVDAAARRTKDRHSKPGGAGDFRCFERFIRGHAIIADLCGVADGQEIRGGGAASASEDTDPEHWPDGAWEQPRIRHLRRSGFGNKAPEHA